MRFFEDFGRATTHFWSSIGYIFKHHLYYYFLFPVVIYITVTYGFYSLFETSQTYALDWLLDLFNLKEEIEDGFWSMIKAVIVGTTSLIVKLFFIFTTWTLGKYIVMIVLSPVFAFLSEKIEEIETGKSYPFDPKQFAIDVWRGIKITLRNLFFELAIILACFVCSFFFPPFAVAAPFIKWYFSWYFLGFAFMDYNLERKKFTTSHSVKFFRKYNGAATGNGFWFDILFKIPLIGMIFAPILAVTAGTRHGMEILKPFEEKESQNL